MSIDSSKWIWENAESAPDEHTEFLARFNYDSADGRVYLSISADSDFGIYLNGTLVNFGQYPDYPHYKVYDKFDVTDYLHIGENILAVEAWYLGNDCSTNIDDGAGICFSLDTESKNILVSDESVLSRLSRVYRNYACKCISGQLGFGYGYDSTVEDNWKLGETSTFSGSVSVTPEKPLPTVLRPVKNLITEEAVKGILIKEEHGNIHRYLFDFGKELVGIYKIKFKTAVMQDIELCYGEHIVDGWVRDKIHNRHFSFDYKAKAGDNEYLGYFRRLGLRYAELRTTEEIENIVIEILPRVYPLARNEFKLEDAELQSIYDICENTLRLCMHEHYEDCPWREQAMYVMDSRNQMICGYYAFKEYAFPRACLKLMAEDRRPDGMLSITYPGASGLAIPSFGLHFFTAVREYGDYSGDWAFVDEIFPKLESVINVFIKHCDAESGLLNIFGESCYWNFYEWSEGLSGVIGSVDEERPDLIINTLFSIALDNMHRICMRLGKESCYGDMAGCVNAAINKTFKDSKTGLYGMYGPYGEKSELGNALAVLCGAADQISTARICDELTSSESGLVKATLSMKGFKYDALLYSDKEKYSHYIIEDIRNIYRKMLDFGSTTVWETEKGERDFDNAGSLCHGWSALPIYYFHTIL
ncbi:MAG: family 78 glycoside hydrolase catalytic domain [Clostridia bacterium]|nr:family 78 glycoside hydrolase catalytic domain [Clostridia bacterium]